MGRTLHYKIKKTNNSKFTKKEMLSILEVSDYYNSGQFKDIWTCENFYAHPLDYFPNWRRWGGTVDSWEDVNIEYSKLKNKGLDEIEIIRTLHKNKIVAYHDKDIEYQVRGFVKVQGNEFNASLVIMALADISMKLKNVEIEVSDEGEFLICPLKIRNGKAMPLIEDLIDDIKYWSMKMLLSEGFKGNILNKLILGAKDFCHEFMMDLQIENGYGDMTKYINNNLSRLKLIEQIILKHPKFKSQPESWERNEDIVAPYIRNILNLKPEHWFIIGDFCRKVNAKDFKDYKMSVGTLMGGFRGEYWNLDPESDDEKLSYEMLAKMTKALEGVEKFGGDVKILGADES